MNLNKIEKYWNNFKQLHTTTSDTYEAWPFGDNPELATELAQLVLEGKKTATASAYAMYQAENDQLPEVGQYNIILDGQDEPVAIVQTTVVDVIPFDQISSEHAYLEGEGDRSLQYWKDVHEAFFARELLTINQSFSEQMLVVCERFKLLYPFNK
ncbi:ASCH domain-containing protein [Gracilibacillus sp. S3-1-1]|uniref:ASCH domain-containing protein n=1 Tax=Gracilibacillus pellucidus TaxID=3095368 RepID=A0ACC6M9D2_9BACI|nr:ASCH domain-containing protein [Gracilibacillus sp. S3-1-1]MDX8047462.1 ASCH domain-containing protein [Gracilibacillus sp. S3-1-1]